MQSPRISHKAAHFAPMERRKTIRWSVYKYPAPLELMRLTSAHQSFLLVS